MDCFVNNKCIPVIADRAGQDLCALNDAMDCVFVIMKGSVSRKDKTGHTLPAVDVSEDADVYEVIGEELVTSPPSSAGDVRSVYVHSYRVQSSWNDKLENVLPRCLNAGRRIFGSCALHWPCISCWMASLKVSISTVGLGLKSGKRQANVV